MQDNGVNVQKFRVAATKDDAVKISQSFSEFLKKYFTLKWFFVKLL